MEQRRIIKALSGFYYVQTEDGVLVECRARGRFRRQDQSPLVGDLVLASRAAGRGQGRARGSFCPASNAFIRPAVANIDQLVVLASCAVPVTEPFLIDRVLAIAQLQSVPALVVVNKDNLASAQPLAIYRKAGVPVLVTSAETGEGIGALHRARRKALVPDRQLRRRQVSLLNCVCPGVQLPVGEVSEKLGRGRHTTRHIELYALAPDTFVADTPGFSAFDTERMELVHKEQLQYAFPEFGPYLGHCQFPDCAHRKEPGCAVERPSPTAASARPATTATSVFTKWPAKSRSGNSNKRKKLPSQGPIPPIRGKCPEGTKGVGMLAAKLTERLSQICNCRLSPTAPSFPSCRKRRGRKGRLVTRLVLPASEFRQVPIFQASFHSILTLRASWYAPPDTGVPDL